MEENTRERVGGKEGRKRTRDNKVLNQLPEFIEELDSLANDMIHPICSLKENKILHK